MIRAVWTMYRTSLIKQHCQISAKNLSTICNGSQKRQSTKAVIFDMGGVVLPAPFEIMKGYEKIHGIPMGTIGKTILQNGEKGAWAKLERGELTAEEFGKLFSAECSSMVNKDVDMSYLLSEFNISDGSGTVRVHQEIVSAIKCLRAEGVKTALLTNNWLWNRNGQSYCPVDHTLFDVVIESCQVGMRKPETRIYKHVLEKLEVSAGECVFLDDIGINLKPAKAMGMRTIKVSDSKTAMAALAEETGVEVRCYADGTITTPERLKINLVKLRSYLNWVLKLHSRELPLVRCYEHGQSNPTYFIQYAGKNMVLRKKPPGNLLPSAHAVEREYRIMKALSYENIPVPKMMALCQDSSLLGTPFYIMEHVPGRIFKDPMLPECTAAERQLIYKAMCDVLAKIHKVDINKAGLEDYGKQGNYMKRNFQRWAKQYEASATQDIPAMNELMKWLLNRMPTNEKISVVHGDFRNLYYYANYTHRLDNLIFHPSKIEVVAVIDWELSTIGDPLTDVATNCVPYYVPKGMGFLSGLANEDLPSLGIASVDEYVKMYSSQFDASSFENWDMYAAFTFFRFAAILQGVYKRSLLGQASSSTAAGTGILAQVYAEIGWDIAKKSKIPPTPVTESSLNDSVKGIEVKRRNINSTNSTTMPSVKNYSTSAMQDIPGSLPLSPKSLSSKAVDIHQRIISFIMEHISPLEPELGKWSTDPNTKWQIHPKVEELKKLAKDQGLWNLFLPKESDPNGIYGAGLTNVEYAFLCEEMGKYPSSAEIFNCSAPDTGNMEVLVRYASEEIKKKYLIPLLNGQIRSCFAMTEPMVASSDATNIQSSIMKDGDHYIINGHKWWTSGAMDPRCKVCIFMGKTRTDGPIHKQQSMIVIPMDAPGVKILRHLTVFGYDDSPHGHAEIRFDNVRVPASHMLLGEGRGFEIAQGRLGPGRIHHCMRLIGSAERALTLMLDREIIGNDVLLWQSARNNAKTKVIRKVVRGLTGNMTVQNRVVFGKPIASQSSIQQDIAKSRIEIEQCRLLVLKAAHMMDTVGNKVAGPEIAMIKVAAPSVVQNIVDRAIQAFGGMGVCQDTPLAPFLVWARIIRIADGPDEVHMKSIAKMEIRKHNLAKL